MAKLCFRPSDNSIGRAIKLTHYCDISMKYCGKLPDDWHIFVRDTKDLPLVYKDTDDEGAGVKARLADRLEGQEVHLRTLEAGGRELRSDQPAEEDKGQEVRARRR